MSTAQAVNLSTFVLSAHRSINCNFRSAAKKSSHKRSISFGFRIHFQGAEQSFEARNLRSALQNPAAVDARLTNNQVKGIKLTFETFKHNYNQRHCRHFSHCSFSVVEIGFKPIKSI